MLHEQNFNWLWIGNIMHWIKLYSRIGSPNYDYPSVLLPSPSKDFGFFFPSDRWASCSALLLYERLVKWNSNAKNIPQSLKGFCYSWLHAVSNVDSSPWALFDRFLVPMWLPLWASPHLDSPLDSLGPVRMGLLAWAPLAFLPSFFTLIFLFFLPFNFFKMMFAYYIQLFL